MVRVFICWLKDRPLNYWYLVLWLKLFNLPHHAFRSNVQNNMMTINTRFFLGIHKYIVKDLDLLHPSFLEILVGSLCKTFGSTCSYFLGMGYVF